MKYKDGGSEVPRTQVDDHQNDYKWVNIKVEKLSLFKL